MTDRNGSAERALMTERPGRYDVPVVALVSLVALTIAVFLPALTFDGLFGDSTYSVWTGIIGFFVNGNLLLGLVLAAFSIVFPVAKLITLLVLWFTPLPNARRVIWVHRLELLGKWSLLDAFVIALLVGSVQLGALTSARPEPGVYLYLAAILGSLVATALVRPLVDTDDHEVASERFSRGGLLFTVPAAVAFGIGLSLPLMSVEKGWFWESRYSVLDGTAVMFREHSAILAVAVAVFVVVLPTLRFVGVAILRWRTADDDGALTVWLRRLDLWSTVDVFAIALLVVFTKLGDLATVEPRAGMWCLLAGSVLSSVDSFLLHTRR